MSVRVIIGDDHKIVRDGLRALLREESDIELVGEAENGLATVRMAEEMSPDVVIMDISMPDLSGIEATRQIVTNNPKIKVIALSMHSHKQYVLGMLKVGASGFLLKDCAFEELSHAIRSVSMNKAYLSPSVSDVVVKDYVGRLKNDELSVYSILTPREREVLKLIAEGKTAKSIASILNISVKTVDAHRQKIIEKLDIHTAAGLTKFAIREGLTSL